MKKILSLTIASVTLAACGKTPAPKGGNISYPPLEAKTHKGAVDKIKQNSNLRVVKMITDGGSVEDKSFNQTIWNGVSAYTGTGEEHYVIPGSAKSQELETTYSAIMKDTQLLVAGGYQHQAPLTQFVGQLKENQGVIFIDGEIVHPKIMSVVFKTEQAGFFAGYFAGEHLSKNASKFDVKGSEGLKVGTYGGMNFGSVTGFMAGFQQGIEYWNTNKAKEGKKIQFIKLGTKVDSYFSGNFKAGAGKPISEKLVNMGADIILPVAGPQTIDTLTAITEKGKNTLVIGVDTDQVIQYADYSNRFLTSITKNMDTAVTNGIKHIYGETEHEGYGLGKTVVGTIKNDLVGLAAGGENILSESDWESMKADEKLMAAAKKTTNTFKI